MNPTEPGYYTTLDRDIIDKLYHKYLEKENELWQHIDKSHSRITSRTNKWDQEIPEIMDYLEKNTYPPEGKTYTHWVNVYGKNDAKKSFKGLHQDSIPFMDHLNDKKNLLIVNSILLYQSDDMEGGEVVIAGDGPQTDTNDVSIRKYDTRDIMSRLEVVQHKNIGDVIWWNCFALHGVASVTKGTRITMAYLKTVPYDEKYFKVNS